MVLAGRIQGQGHSRGPAQGHVLDQDLDPVHGGSRALRDPVRYLHGHAHAHAQGHTAPLTEGQGHGQGLVTVETDTLEARQSVYFAFTIIYVQQMFINRLNLI